MQFRIKRKTWSPLLLLITVALACSMPGVTQPTTSPPPEVTVIKQLHEETVIEPTLAPSVTAIPQPLPPTLIEVEPAPGTDLPLQGNFTFYFNQPMDKPSVELAMNGQPALSGKFNWIDAETVVFEPDAPLQPDSELNITISTSALSENGQFLREPITLQYHTASLLRVTQLLPEPGALDVDTTSAIVATFNQPVIPFGANLGPSPKALTIDPPIEGAGEWVNSSTYIYYPELAMVGGTSYTVRLNPNLTSAYGTSFEGRRVFEINAYEWSFETALPRLVSLSPGNGATAVDLDTVFQVEFSQPMDIASIEENFFIFDPEQNAIEGDLGWDENQTKLTFTPTNLLARDTNYTITLLGAAQTIGGTSMGFDTVARIRTVPLLKIVKTQPENKGIKQVQDNVTLAFNIPARQIENPLQFITFTPNVDNLNHWWGDFNRSLNIQGDLQPLSVYTVTVSDEFPDPWGASIGEPYTFTFNTATLNPAIHIAHGSPTLTLSPQDSTIYAQITNIDQIEMGLGSISFEDLLEMLTPGSYNLYQDYQPEEKLKWTHQADIPGDKPYEIQLPINPEEHGLEPGIYYLRIVSPELTDQLSPFLLVSTNVQMSFKLSTTNAFVWAIDLRTMEPVTGVPITIYDSAGARLASGSTDSQGIFQSPLNTQSDLNTNSYAVMSKPGDEFFSLSLSNWSQGIKGDDFGYKTDFTAFDSATFLYTNRTAYHPGQQVYYHGVVRYEHNGRYALPDSKTIAVTFYDGENTLIQQDDQIINEFGTIQGEYLLPEDAQPGIYQIAAGDEVVTFQVLEGREKEISIKLTVPESILAGETILAEIKTRYSFNIPAGNVPLTWKIYRNPISFNLPGFHVGLDPYRWLEPPWSINLNTSGELVASGEGRTDREGQLLVQIPTDVPATVPYRYTLEATLRDNNGFPVHNASDITVHPGDFYIGLHPDTWVGQTGDEISFNVFTVDWLKTPLENQELTAMFREVSWIPLESVDPFDYPRFSPQYKLTSSADLITGEDGIARLAFTPPKAGVYQLVVSGTDAETSILIWVDGKEQALWPNLPNNHIKLTADAENYLPGDTAQVFIPNPLKGRTQVLVTVERDEILRYDVFTLESSGISYPLNLQDQDAPNVYVSVTLIGKDSKGRPDFRYGYLNLKIKPIEKELSITFSFTGLDSEEEPQLEPGDEVDLNVQITDFMGRPVRGVFSLTVDDLGSSPIADENMVDILKVFYGEQPLGVRTGMTLVVYSQQQTEMGGDNVVMGEDAQSLNGCQDLPETIFWQADILSDENGQANLTLKLPDNPTTYQVVLRAVSSNTLVGQIRDKWVTSDELLVQPVLPYFLVAGDHTELAAVIHNQTPNDLHADVSLQSNGFTLDETKDETQKVLIPALGSIKVAWWGRVEETPHLELGFSASMVDRSQTATKPYVITIPVTSFTAPQTFNTAGILDLEGEKLVMISLPRTYTTTAGILDITLAPSLAAAMTDGLDFLENYPYASAEVLLSSFLPNLLAYRITQDLGIEAPGFAARFDRTTESAIQKLIAQQNGDGGWGWWLLGQNMLAEEQPSQTSDPFLTAYILFGLSKAKQAGVFVDDAIIEKSRNYILATLPDLEILSSTWQLDRLAFDYLVLSLTGEDITETAKDFFDVRDQLSPYAKSFLALTLGNDNPEDIRIETILSDLETSAIQSETGVHWQGKDVPANLDTPILNTAITVYTLAQYDPASHLLPDALGYLMAHRKADGSWGSTYETAWTLMAFTEVMKGTGELAGNFAFSASVNGEPIIEGQAGGNTRLNTVSATIPTSSLYPKTANGLSIWRSAGPGRLYYSAHLNVNQPAVEVETQSHGVHVTRSYQIADGGTQAAVGDLVIVRVSLTLENDVHYLILEDFIPAGVKILDAKRKTEQTDIQAGCGVNGANCYLPRVPFSNGWGWWWFEEPLIYDDHITWATSYIPAGTYELTYTLVLTRPGDFQILPARAWGAYFPEVFGNSVGEVFTINE